MCRARTGGQLAASSEMPSLDRPPYPKPDPHPAPPPPIELPPHPEPIPVPEPPLSVKDGLSAELFASVAAHGSARPRRMPIPPAISSARRGG